LLQRLDVYRDHPNEFLSSLDGERARVPARSSPSPVPNENTPRLRRGSNLELAFPRQMSTQFNIARKNRPGRPQTLPLTRALAAINRSIVQQQPSNSNNRTNGNRTRSREVRRDG